jgi:alkylated DNA repair dioxygenase AlkB
MTDLIWLNDSITMFGKTYPQPRQTAFHGDPGLHYTYSKIKMISPGWTPALLKLKKKLEKDLDTTFNSVLINYYRDGADHMSYHADNEPELGMNPTVAAVSFGAIRKFHLKHRYEKTRPPIIIELADQSLLVMKGELQHNWLHKISKSKKVLGPRLSLTFRLLRSFL